MTAIVIGARLLASDAARPRDKPFDLRDSRLTGFILRVNPSGVRAYYAQVARGQRKKLALVGEMTPDEARELCTKVLGNVAHGREPFEGIAGKVVGSATKLGEFIDDTWLPYAMANLKSWRKIKYALDKHFAKWRALPLDAITPAMLIKDYYTARLAKGCKASSVVRDGDALAGVMTHAVLHEKIPASPFLQLRKRKPKLDQNPAVRFLSIEEERRLRGALAERDRKMIAARDSANDTRRRNGREAYPTLPHYGDHLTPAVLLSMLTGMRRGELLRLRWSQVNLERKLITLSITKGVDTRHQPLEAEALQVLKRWHAQRLDDVRVFPFSSSFKRSWLTVKKRAGLVGEYSFKWNDLRHSYASALVQLDTSLNTVRELLGHKDPRTTLRYAHLAHNDKARAVGRLADRAKQVNRRK